MQKKFKRFLSFIMAMIMTIGSLNIAYGYDPNSQNTSGTASSSGSSTVSGNSSDEISTGYKVQLLFLQLSEETYKHKNEEGGEQLVLNEWNNAKTNVNDSMGTGNVIQRVGEPVYITTQHNKDAGSYTATQGFKYGDFDYGLGTRTGKTGIDRSSLVSKSDIMDTVETVNSTMTSLSLSDSNLSAYMSMSSSLPIYIGKSQQNSNVQLKDYFMVERTQVENAPETNNDGNGNYLPKTNYVSLVNYIATNEGKYPDKAIYFTTVAVQQGSKYVAATPTVPGGAANVYNTGIYKGMKGEYRLIITPVYLVNSSTLGGITALTARDMAWVAQNLDPLGTSEGSIIWNQSAYFKDLCKTTTLSREDIFEMKAPTSTSGTTSNFIDYLLSHNQGFGIAVFTSEMVWDPHGEEMYIGSISHVFMPGSLSSDNKDITTASMEYIGAKGDQNATEDAFEKAAIQIAKALAGGSTDQDNNVFTNSALDQSVVLNGTIKLPGLSNSSKISSYQNTYGYAKDNEKNLIAQIEEAINQYSDSEQIREGIKDVMAEQLGIDFDNPTAGQIQMQDLNLLIYTLSRYQLDGVEANEDGWNQPTGNSAANIWKKILAYQAMLKNTKSQNTIKENASGNWSGPLGITEDDIKHYISGNKIIGSTILGDGYTTQTYANTSDGADKAIEDGVLDNKSGGQISGSSANWDKILNAGELENGLVRIPVAMGNTQLYIGAGEDTTENVNVTKGMIPSATGDMLKSAVETYLAEKDNAGFKGVNLYDGITGLWDPSLQHVLGIFNTTSSIDDISIFKSNTALGKYLEASNNATLFSSITKSASFNSVYGSSDMKNGEKIDSIDYNTFGLNQLINIGIAGNFYGKVPSGSTSNTYMTDMNANNKDLQHYTGTVSHPDKEASPDGAIAVPSYIYKTARADMGTPTIAEIASNYTQKMTDMNKDASVVNDAVFANTSNNDPSLILAVNNYMLNKGLASTAALLRSDVPNTPATSMHGDYGISYVIWDAGMPIDIQFVTEVNGEIVPVEGATELFDNGLISNVWYASPNTNKALQLQKYYTVKDKDGNDVTLEVEEAVVKSATVNNAETLKGFYEAYTKAYNNDDEGFFSYDGNGENGKTKYFTKRTKFDKTSGEQSNVDTYIKTHEEFEGSSVLRYIQASGDSLGMPVTLAQLTNSVVNTIDVVPTDEDMNSYIENPTGSRLQVIVKVKASHTIKQYNMIIGLEGNYVQEVDPVIEDGKVILETTIPTNTGYAQMTPRDNYSLPEATPNWFPTGKTVVATNKDINPNDEKPDWIFEDFMLSQDESGKYRFIEDSVYSMRDELDDYNTYFSDDPAVEIVRSSDIISSLEIPDNTRAIYVRYVEQPPMYEVYRDTAGNEQVVKRAYTLTPHTGVNGDNPLGSTDNWYPVMAVAASIDFANSNDDTVFTIDEDTGKKALNTPENWQWVLDNLTTEDNGVVKYIGGTSDEMLNENINKSTFLSIEYHNSQGRDRSNSAALYPYRDVQTIGLNGLYHTVAGDPITLTGIIQGSFGDGVGRTFGYSDERESFTTKEAGEITLWNNRVGNDNISSNATYVATPGKDLPGLNTAYSQNQGYSLFSTSMNVAGAGQFGNSARTAYDIVENGRLLNKSSSAFRAPNASSPYVIEDVNLFTMRDGGLYGIYPIDYEQPQYVIYILYVQEEGANIIRNSFYTVLPQDMITRAVAYKDLARQYYQREQVMRLNASKAEASTGDENTKLVKISIADLSADISSLLNSMGSVSAKNYNLNGGSKRTVGFSGSGNSLSFTFPKGTRNGDTTNVDWSNKYASWGTQTKSLSSYSTLNAFINANTKDGHNINAFVNALNNVLQGISLTVKLDSRGNVSADLSSVFATLQNSAFSIANLLVTPDNGVVSGTEDMQETETSKYWQCNFENWYTLYISLGDNVARRRDYDGSEKYEDYNFESITGKVPGDKVEFGPTYEEVYDGGSPYLKSASGDNATKIELKTDEDGESYEVETRYHSYLYSNPNYKASGLTDYGAVVFGILTSDEQTPATVGNHDGTYFFATKDYDSREILKNNTRDNLGIAADGAYWDIKNTSFTDGSKYWADTYHYYNDYNFYIMVWRGIDKPTLASAPLGSEQTGVADLQRNALNELTSDYIGSLNGNTNGFESQRNGLKQPEITKAKDSNYWYENMYNANVMMGNDVDVETTNPTSSKLFATINGFRYQYYIDGEYKPGQYPHWELDNGKGTHTGDITGMTSPILQSVSYTELTKGYPSIYTKFKGSLVVDALIDKAGAGYLPARSDTISSFTLNGGNVYGTSTNIEFNKVKSLTVSNTWTDSRGRTASIWVNWYPWVKMRYQTIEPNTYYTPGNGQPSPVETKDVYVLSSNQSSMQLNSAIEIGFNRGQGYSQTDGTSPNKLEIGSTQWSTHANAIKNKGKGNVLPGGAIYTLTTGSLTKLEDRLARSKVGIRYWKPYIPSSMQDYLVTTNRVGEGDRYTTNADANKEYNLVFQRYVLGVDPGNDPTFRSIVEAAMQTVNNATVGLHIDGISPTNAYESTTDKYKLDKETADTSEVTIENPRSGEDSKGNSASLDSLSFVMTTPTFYRVWSDAQGNVYFGWKAQRNEPTISELEAIGENNCSTTAGYVKILSQGQKIENSGSWVKDSSTGQYMFNDASLGNGVPYGVDLRTSLISNYVNAIERNIGYTVRETMPPTNAADSNHLLYDMTTATGGEFNQEKYKDSAYGGTQGNGIGTPEGAEGITSYTGLVNMFTRLKSDSSQLSKWNPLVSALGASETGLEDGKGIGYKWLTYNMGRNSSASYSMENGWYNEASDGFGVVSYGGIIEVGFGYPAPDGSNTPVRTSIIDPEWQLPHTDRASLFTQFRSAYFYVEPDPITNFVVQAYGTGGTYAEDYTGSDHAFIGIQTSASEPINWLDIDEGLSWLYRSRVFYIGNGSVMDLN